MCDSLCLVGSAGTLFAKNSDRPVGEVQVVEWLPARDAGGTVRTQYLEIPDTGAFALVASRPTWLWGLEHGVNERRVAIGNERVWTSDHPAAVPAALIGMDLVRLGLERGASASAAIDVMVELLERHGQGGPAEGPDGDPYWSSFLVADPTEAWVLETSGRSWAARRSGPGSGVAISNRLSIGADWDRASADVSEGTAFEDRRDRAWAAIADVRLACTLPAVAATSGAHSAADLVGIMRHHGDRPWGRPGDDPTDVSPLPPSELGPDGSGVTVCMHVRGYQATAASMVVDLPVDPESAIRLWAALGSPCCSVYLPAPGPGAGGASALADPATWARFDALRQRAEASADGLTEIRAVLGPVEAALWAAGTDGWSEVDAALSNLGV